MKIAIIGAGMNGLIFGIALRRLGFLPEEIEIYEREVTPRVLGTGIIFSKEALVLFEKLGINLRTEGLPLFNIKNVFFKEDGRSLDIHIEKPEEQAAYGFLREKIYRRLLAEIEKCGITIKAGYECKRIIEENNQCYVKLTHSDRHDETIMADVVIGADGIFSKVRQSLFSFVSPVSLDIRAYRGNYLAGTAHASSLGLPVDACHIYCGENWRVILYPNMNKREVMSYYWFAAYRINPQEQNNYVEAIADTEIEALIGRLTHCPLPLSQMFRETATDQILRSNTLRQLYPLEYYHSGRVALLGDAAHAMAPTAGLGVLLGVINALHLAGNLKKYKHDIPRALEEYTNAISTDSASFLRYTSELTSAYYTENPLGAAGNAKATYGALSQLANDATNHVIDFIDDFKKKEVAAARKIVSFFLKNKAKAMKQEDVPRDSLTL